MIIYKITNIKNGKVYIGQTIRTFDKRFKEHMKSAFNKNSTQYSTKFYKDIRKFGKESFVGEIIKDNIKTVEELEKEEKYYIEKYNSINEGYNTILGSSIKQTDEIKNKISDSQKGIKNHMFGLSGGLSPTSKPVRCITEDKIFMSVVEAAKYYNTSSSNIRENIYGKRKSCCKKTYGKALVFEYLDKDKYNPYISHAIKKVKKQDTYKKLKNLYNGKIFKSKAEAFRAYNIPEEEGRNTISSHLAYIDSERKIFLVEEKYFDYSIKEMINLTCPIYNETLDIYYYTLPEAIKDIIDYDRSLYEKYRGKFRREGKLIINNNIIIKNVNYKVDGRS